MLTKLFIKNFQNHKKRALKLGQITTLVGRSDSGKSAILRALIWLLTNKPRGTAFVSHGEKLTSVGLEVDGIKITRTRSGNKNEYTLDGDKYVAFGDTVPPQIADMLNIGTNNIQRQHDSVFWLGLSPGELSRQMNAVVDLEIIDTATKRTKKIKTEAASREKFEKERFNHWTEEVKKRAFVPALVKDAAIAQAAQRDVVHLDARVASLGHCLAATRHSIQKEERQREIAAQAAACNELLIAYRDTGKSLNYVSIRVQEIQKSPHKNMEDEMQNLQKRSDAIDILLTEVEYLKTMITVLQERNKELCQLKKAREKKEKYLRQASKKITCRTCGQIMDASLS